MRQYKVQGLLTSEDIDHEACQEELMPWVELGYKGETEIRFPALYFAHQPVKRLNICVLAQG